MARVSRAIFFALRKSGSRAASQTQKLHEQFHRIKNIPATRIVTFQKSKRLSEERFYHYLSSGASMTSRSSYVHDINNSMPGQSGTIP
jgi:hypothetical protein